MPGRTSPSRSPSDEGIDPSVGSVGDAFDALAETTVGSLTVGSFKHELLRRQAAWRDSDHVEVDPLQRVHRFNTERPHEYLDDVTPDQAERPTTIYETWQPPGNSANRVPGHAGRSHHSWCEVTQVPRRNEHLVLHRLAYAIPVA